MMVLVVTFSVPLFCFVFRKSVFLNIRPDEDPEFVSLIWSIYFTHSFCFRHIQQPIMASPLQFSPLSMLSLYLLMIWNFSSLLAVKFRRQTWWLSFPQSSLSSLFTVIKSKCFIKGVGRQIRSLPNLITYKQKIPYLASHLSLEKP